MKNLCYKGAGVIISLTSTIVADLLGQRWRNFTTSLSCETQVSDKIYSLIADSYHQFFRHYHGFNHLADCFNHLDEIKETLAQPAVVEYALWFHDIVCVPNSKSNETVSAVVADYAADQLGVAREFSRQATNLILLTSHKETADSQEGAYLLDIDLAVLGRDWDGFLCYEEQIRDEYSHLDTGTYQQGRRQIIEQFLGKPAIYQTDYFREKYEQAARRNLTALKDLFNNICEIK